MFDAWRSWTKPSSALVLFPGKIRGVTGTIAMDNETRALKSSITGFTPLKGFFYL